MNSENPTDAVKLLLERIPKRHRLECYKWLRDSLDNEIGAPLGNNVHDIELRGGSQSKAFMIALLPKIWAHMLTRPRATTFSILDVGPGAGFGTELLASIHAGSFLGYKAEVSILDIRDNYFELMEYRLPHIKNRLKKNIYDLEQAYDLVICSHVVEHVPDPVRFVRRLQTSARQKVFVLTPWQENRERLTSGHINIFSESFVNHFEDSDWELMENIAWGAFLQPRYKMLYMGLPGLA